MRDAPHVTVCVCTFRRPALLGALLRALAAQVTGDRLTFDVVVVDNDAAQTAQPIVARAAAEGPLRVTCHVEPRRGVAYARNTALAHATGQFIALIDDDETPEPEWLLTLLTAIHEHRADGVLGPVLPAYEPGTPAWVIRGGFYERPRHASGRLLRWRECRTGNALLSRAMLDGQPAPFDPAFRVGEDQEFFKRMIAAGRIFVWCDTAVVHEAVPPDRWGRAFLVKRAALRGAFSRAQRPGSLWPVAHSAVAAPAYLAAMPVAMLFGHAAFMNVVFKCSYHWGRLFPFVTQ